jgi:hypothetical protein
MVFFLALDWTITPLSYFFATTAKPGLKVVLALLLAVVAFGAFEGYFTATERLIQLRLVEITKARLAVENAEDWITKQKANRDEILKQQEGDRAERDKTRDTKKDEAAHIDQQIAVTLQAQADDKAQHLKNMAEIKDACLKVPYICLGPKLDAELGRHTAAQAELAQRLDKRQARRTEIDKELTELNRDDDSKVGPANKAVADAEKQAAEKRETFEALVLGNQVYRWTAALYGKSPRKVTAEEANKVLDIFAAAVALAYVLTQVFLSIAYFGRNRPGLVETNRAFLRERVIRAWEYVLRARRAFWLRKRRGVYRHVIKEVPVTEYRDREVVKEVFVPTSERTKVVYVPVPPGGPVPPAEEFVRQAHFEGVS